MSESFDYQQEQQKLEKIVDSIQSGGLSIDESFDKYKEAEEIIAKLEKYLKTAQNKITKIKSK